MSEQANDPEIVPQFIDQIIEQYKPTIEAELKDLPISRLKVFEPINAVQEKGLAEIWTNNISPLLNQNSQEMQAGVVYFFVLLLKQGCERIEPMKSLWKIDKYLRVLLGDSYFNHIPHDLESFMKIKGLEKPLNELPKQEIWQAFNSPLKESWIETIYNTLVMVFDQRYSWTEEKVAAMTAPNLCLALEHAMEHDERGKPGIWEMTGGSSKD